jgi:glutathione S-transferase
MLLYNNAFSGNCYKVRLLLAQLGIDYERRELSVFDRSDRADVLGGLNPALRVPTLVFDDGRALKALDRHLADREFLVAGRYTIADIALYAYTHVAPEGDFELLPYAALRDWLTRVAAQPGHIPITG